MGKQIRVLHVLGTTNLGGAESRIMDLYRHIDREKIQFDFLIHTTKEGFFDQEIKQLGGKIYYLPSFRVYNYFAYKKACREFFAAHREFQVVQGHMTSTASIYLPIAKKAGVPMTIAHARSAGVDKGIKGWITKLLRRNLYRKCDFMFSCSDLAAEAVFGRKRVQEEKVIILPNAIDTNAFAADERVREKIRQELAVSENFVIGHVGRFHYAKNHDYLIDVFMEIKKIQNNAVLLLLGDGPLRLEIEKKVEDLGIEKSVLFLGNQSPIAPYYQAMDAFVFPSHFEGMPGTVVEAQAAGVPCFISSTITKGVKATELVRFLDITEAPVVWAEKVLKFPKTERTQVTQIMVENGYDVSTQAKRYEAFYLTKNIDDMKGKKHGF